MNAPRMPSTAGWRAYIGRRVELSPTLDLWMRGARFGTVEKVGRDYIGVRVDKVNRVKLLRADEITLV